MVCVGVRFLSYMTVGLISLSFFAAYGAIHLVPADWWVGVNAEKGIPDTQKAYSQIFGQGMWIIVASIVAFLVGQILDVFIFHQIKEKTGEKMIWLRATGSTLVSQLIDSLVVIIIAFRVGSGLELGQGYRHSVGGLFLQVCGGYPHYTAYLFGSPSHRKLFRYRISYEYEKSSAKI
jgi:uncharacterized PurR-regulated membrane protein YhhQ (DUF165 family)